MKISVVIPALNEAGFIARAISSVRDQCEETEIIVVDGGSTDRTPDRARSFARVVTAAPGRASQMNIGAKASQSDLLLFLHADSILHPHALTHLREALDDPETVGGTFTLRFDSSRFPLGLLSYLTRFRFRLFHFGDQGIFVRKSVFESIEGFRDIPIMEDLDLLNRLRRLGRVCLVRKPITTSARRFLENGPVRQQLLNCFLVCCFLLGASPWTLARWYSARREP